MPREAARRASRSWTTAFMSVFLVFVATLLSPAAMAASVSLAWDAVPQPNVAGYMLYSGPAAGNYTTKVDVGGNTTSTVSNLTEGATLHFAVTAYDAARSESGYSNDVATTVPYSKPVAAFSASTTTGTAPLAMNFINSSTGTITSNAWTFGDGGTSTTQSPSHTYTSAGTYTVSLTVTGPGGSNTRTNSNYITVSGATAAPVAAFSGSPTSGTAPLAVTFSSGSSGNISAYSWSFGDGATSSAQSPSHTYTAAGTYSVSLTVTGAGGTNTKTSTNYITVSAASAAPVAAFSASPTSGNAPLTVGFSNASTGNVSTYAWNFGDGSTSSTASPSHVYSTAGTYTVSLTVSGPGGTNTKTSAGFITVTAASSGSNCPCTIWPSSAAPTVAADSDKSAVELGVKFESDVAGYITGIRFYKSATNAGTHIGSLWSSSGQLLARATFSGESTSGWQQVIFSTPVAISANTVYVASYHTNVGHYANDDNFFANAGVDRPPLHALRNGSSGSNGVYTYASTPAFPTSTYRATNYWVDVVFTTSN